jgi:hypothetical protein
MISMIPCKRAGSWKRIGGKGKSVLISSYTAFLILSALTRKNTQKNQNKCLDNNLSFQYGIQENLTKYPIHCSVDASTSNVNTSRFMYSKNSEEQPGMIVRNVRPGTVHNPV